MARLAKIRLVYYILLLLMLSACNLSNTPEQQLALTEMPTNTSAPTRTSISGVGGLPTTLPITQVAPPTSQSLVLPPTSNSIPPTFRPFPTNTPTPISIVILSPIPSNVVAGNVQVLGAAIHPLFLQYQLEYGPDPNPGNLWYPATGISQNPVFNGLLGIWNTTQVQDSVYQLRLRVTLRDGTSLATIVNNIRIQNQAPTPVPSATPNIPRPIAAFTQDRTTGQAPLVVRFINQSSGNITNFTWTFGDGGSSAEANPVYTFRSPGVYYVTLTVSGPGGTSNVTQQINVQSPSAPVAAFTQDTTSGPSPLTVKFTNQSTGNITGINWAFGDGTVSTEPNPTHQFVAVGTYNVILGIAGPGGTSFVTRKITVQDPVIPPPVAAFTPDKATGNTPLLVQFANQSTGQITSYAWDFGDGQTSVDKNPTHTFTAAGEFTVKLTVIGPGGQNVVQTKITAVKPPDAPVAAFTQNTTSGNAPLAVQFTNQSSGNITGYSWDFGDGSPLGTDKDPSHTYANVGTYTVKLKVTGAGGTSEAQSTITATKPVAAPVAAFIADPISGTAPLNVQFTNQSTGESLTYAWDFGDNTSIVTDANPVHSYAAVGTYTAKLTVTNSAGSNATQKTITVNAAPVAPVASFTADPTTGNAALNVTFVSTSTGDFNTYAWSIADSNGAVLGTADTANTSFLFQNAGTYTVTLTVSGLGGSDVSDPQTITVNAAPVAPVASFTTDPTTGNAPLVVNFTSTSSGDNLTYLWDFGDGTTGTDANPAHEYAQVGQYIVTLTVSNNGGSDPSDPQTITVNAAPVAPVASFTADPTTGNAPLVVNFTSTSSGDNLTYLWDFGDGTTGTDANPAHEYAQVGQYTVTLTVSGLGGSDVSDSQTITVNAAPVAPVASFTADPTTGNAPLVVNFTSTSSGDNLTYLWDFGDGTTGTDANPAHEYAPVGQYIVTLTVSNNGGSDPSDPQTITVNAAPVAPVASFTADPTTGNAALNVTFVSTSTGDFNTYAWSIADSNGAVLGTADTANTSFLFQNAGMYTVTLTVSGLGGSDVSDPQTITVNAAPVAPVASFTADPTTGNAPLVVNFTSTSSGDNLTYLWDFGDGTTGTDANPAHEYAQVGQYTVTLTVSNNGGSDPSDPQTITVNAAAVVPVPPALNDAIVFVSNRSGNDEIYLLTTDGTVSNLTNNGASDTSPSASPDGNRIAFVSNRDGNDEIYLMNRDGSNVIRLTDNPATDGSPVWSPDGSVIVFITSRDGNYEIYSINPDGSNPVNLTNAPSNETYPAPSPDGTRLAFMSDRDGNNEIYVQSMDGTILNVSNSPASTDAGPTWSPNSNQIAFVSDRESLAQIYVVNADGSNPVRLSDATRPDTRPSWSPDGTQIIFVSQDNGLSQVYVMNTDGSAVTKVSDGTGNDSAPSWVP